MTSSMISLMPYDHRDLDAQYSGCSENDLIGGFKDHFDRSEAVMTYNGRSAINAIVRQLNVVREDEIFITTTFDYPNVSSCVTATIFNSCKPARVLTDKTRAIFVIHEFGVPHKNTPELRKLADQRGIPLIEDCAHTIDSERDGWKVGSWGDYVIVTFNKLFPVWFGGVLLGQNIQYQATDIEQQTMNSVLPTITHFWPTWSEQAQRRREIFHKYTDAGLTSTFEISSNITPWFFTIETENWERLIKGAREQGVDCGVWHGTNVVVLPCHQFLKDEQVNHVISVVKNIQKI